MFSISINAQEIEKNGKLYKVKNERIFLDGKDVTETLKLEEKSAILKQANSVSEKNRLKEIALKNEADTKKQAEKLEKEKKKAEKAQKKAEKKQKKAEKALKKKLKAQKKLDKATKKLESSQKKYNKLKGKGKLSPEDEAKWLDKLEGYREAIEKAKKKI